MSISIQVRGVLQRPAGLSFELFGRLASIEFVLSVVNNSSETLVIPASFARDVGIGVERDQRVISAETLWERIDVALADEDAVEVGLMSPFNLEPLGVASFHGLFRLTDIHAFSSGDYTMHFNLRRSVGGVRDAAGKP
jgi:hypothetical protein